MTEPGLTPEQRVARVTELQRQADDAMAALRRRVAAAEQARDRAREVSGEATSQDGTVKVNVDSTGVVTSLTLAPSVFERTTPERLSAAIVATIQAAASSARAGMAEAMAPLRAETERTRAAMAEVPELNALRFDLPEVPRTAVDPTAQLDSWGAATAPEPPARPEPPRPQQPEVGSEEWTEDAERLW